MTSRGPETRPRAGFSLVELLVVITLTTALFTLVISLIQALMKVESAERRRLARAEVSGRLVDLFRADARDAASAEVLDGGAALRLRAPGGRETTYRSEARSVVRESAPRRERFPLPDDVSARFVVERDDGAEIAALETTSGRSPARPRIERVEAAVGRHVALANPSSRAGGRP